MPPFGRNLILTEQEIDMQSSIFSTRDRCENKEEKINEQASRATPRQYPAASSSKVPSPVDSGSASPAQLPPQAQAADASQWPKDAFQQKTEADAIKCPYGKAAEESDKRQARRPGDRRERRSRSTLDQQHVAGRDLDLAFWCPKIRFRWRHPTRSLPALRRWSRTRVKMAKTSKVLALVESGGKVYSATKEVKVTVGGCGG